jgi:copper transport protein
MARRNRLALAVTSALFLTLVARASPAFGHAELVGSEPSDGSVREGPPSRVQLFFSEPVEDEFFALEVYAPDRSRVDRGDARISLTDVRILEAELREIGSGTYTVVWRALSLDSHVVRGSFAFTVGAGAAPGRALDLDLPAAGAPFAVEAGARWLSFLTSFVLLGGFAFRPLVLGAALHTRPAQRRWLWLAWATLALLLGLTFVSLLFQASSAAGTPLGEVLGGRAITRILSATRYGAMWLARVALLLGVVGVLAWLSVSPGGGRNRVWWLGVGLSAGVLLTFSASGHPTAVQGPTALAIVADWAHLLAGGLWVGGLVQLGLTLPAIIGPLQPDERRRLLGGLVPRFSWLAGISAAVLIASGLYASLLYLPSWAALMDTIYGAVLSGKLLLVAPLLAIGAINLLVMQPRFRRAAQARAAPTDDAPARRVFRLLVVGEVALAVAVLGVTGALTGLPPASSLPLEGKPFSEARQVGDLAAMLEITPNQAGENRIAVHLHDRQGRPQDNLRAQITLTMLDMEMGARTVELPLESAGRYSASGSQLSMPGRWQAELGVQGLGGSEERQQYSLAVGQAPGVYRPAFSPAYILVLMVRDPDRQQDAPINPRLASTLAALVAAGAILSYARRARRPARGRLIRVTAFTFLAFGLALGTATVAEAYRKSLPNPVPADGASLARGQQVYFANCAACHGVTGRGDGPAGRTLRPRPADFRVHMAAGHTDRQLFDWITRGVEDTPMPAFGAILSEQEQWDSINYIRTFAQPGS